jgi:hypothetical protein
MKKTIIAIIILALIGFGVYFFTNNSENKAPVVNNPAVVETPTAETVQTPEQISQSQKNDPEVVVGKSVDGNDIKAYRFGTGEKEILFIAGIHGGYSWNTVLLAQQMMDHLKQNPALVPENVKVTIIPVLNPDGLKKVVGTTGVFTKANVPTASGATVAGRFNANQVDLNRNFDCDWQSSGMWQNKKVSGGTGAFSEPETMALKNYVDNNNPTAVVAFYSAAGGVFASSCHNGVSTETSSILKKYADASGYKAYADFDFYEITGDMVNWLAKEGVPAISVLLTNHTDTDWAKNLAGIKALLTHYSK